MLEAERLKRRSRGRLSSSVRLVMTVSGLLLRYKWAPERVKPHQVLPNLTVQHRLWNSHCVRCPGPVHTSAARLGRCRYDVKHTL